MRTISAKVDDKLYELANSIAQENGLTVSAMLKQSFTSAVIKDTAEEKRIFGELKRIGNNLNQVARYTNIKKVLDRQVLASISRIEKEVRKVLC